MKVEMTPTGKVVALLLALALLALVVAFQGPDARRYLKMERM
jgi:hypothetical protein